VDHPSACSLPSGEKDLPHRSLGGIIYDERLTGLAGIGGGEAGDGLDVVEEGEVMDDEDVAWEMTSAGRVAAGTLQRPQHQRHPCVRNRFCCGIVLLNRIFAHSI